MSGSATLGTNLVDSLVPIADELRGSLHADFGVRQFRVWTVSRAWSGGEVGEGSSSDVELELTPSPLVKSWLNRISGLDWRLEPCGIDEAGLVRLSEISLTYTEAELIGDGLANGVEWFIKLSDGRGQEVADRYFTVTRPPFPDRINDIGWTMELLRAPGVGA